MYYALSVDWILHTAPGVPAPPKKVCCKKVLPSVVTAKGGHSECAPFCVFALHSCLECTKGEDGGQDITKLLADCQKSEFEAAI